MGYATVGCTPVVPSSSLTFAAFACHAFVQHGASLWPVNQTATTLTVANTNGVHWLAICRDTTSPVTGWTRTSGTFYMHRQTATDPGSPDGCLRFAKVTVASNIITAIEDLRARRITQLETIAVNSTVGEGAVWHIERCDGPVTVAPSATLTFRGMIQAPPQCWIFADSGAVDFSGYLGKVDVALVRAHPGWRHRLHVTAETVDRLWRTGAVFFRWGLCRHDEPTRDRLHDRARRAREKIPNCLPRPRGGI